MSDANNQIAAKLRETLGLSQSEVAEKLNKAQSYISRCETGNRRLDIFELEAFAELSSAPLFFVEIVDSVRKAKRCPNFKKPSC